MIHPLKIGNSIFPTNLIQGPLAGVSCAPFRLLSWQYSQPAFNYTEMMSCKTILHQPQLTHKRYLTKAVGEGPVCFQLASSHVDELSEAVKRVTALGADLIDLNCGCPVKKIRRKGAGSQLLSTPLKLAELIRAMKNNTNLPIGIKIRVAGNSAEKFNQEIAHVVQEEGADFLVVHGRHWTEGYETPCHYDQIQFFVNELKVPVIGNGDIACLESLKKMFDTGCAGVMISRAGVGQPWLIKQLIAHFMQDNFVVPSNPERGEIFVKHISSLTDLLGDETKAILQARKVAKYYARGLVNKNEFCAAMNTTQQLNVFKELCRRFFI